MVHSKAALSEVFRKKLTTVSVEESLTALDAVKRCLPQIRQCRKRKIDWDTVAELIKQSVQEAYSVDIRLSGITAKDYYYKLTRKKKSEHSQPRSPSTSTTSRKSSTPAPAKTPAQAVQPSVPAVTPVPTPAPEPVARSPAAQSELEPGLKPKSADEAFSSEEAPQPTSQPKEKYREPAFNVPPGLQIPMA